jgi:beta-phosphoglucomutase
MNPNEILPGVSDFLDQIKKEGYLIALGSASKNAEIILNKTGLMHWFDAIIDGNKVTKSKPDPEVFLKGAEALGVSPAECIVFEDAVAGVEAAKTGGMKAIGIGEVSVLNHADKVISSFEGVLSKDLLNFQ